jgi:ribosome-binding factor A
MRRRALSNQQTMKPMCVSRCEAHKSMEKAEEFAKVLERLRVEFEELEALRAAADALRAFRVKHVDVRFD